MERYGTKGVNMSSKRRIRRNACDGKVRYETAEEAWRRITDMKWERTWNPRLVAYHCQFCGGYHVGHQPAKAWRARGIHEGKVV